MKKTSALQGVKRNYEEKIIRPQKGFGMLLLIIATILLVVAGIVLAFVLDPSEEKGIGAAVLSSTVTVYFSAIFPLLCVGFKVVNPNEAAVCLLFGRYIGTIVHEGFFWMNPFIRLYNPGAEPGRMMNTNYNVNDSTPISKPKAGAAVQKKLSLKAMTLNNGKQKVNDELGNPIEIGVIVIWKIVNTAKAVFNVDNYLQFISTQADSAIRQVARQYPYDINDQGDEKSLRGSSLEISEKLRGELQARVEVAGIEIIEAKIAHLAYAPEIPAAMLQRQQATAIIAARQKIVEGAVGMVEMALSKLSENNVCELDEERKAAMVSNLLVVLCGNRDAQPIVNSGSIY